MQRKIVMIGEMFKISLTAFMFSAIVQREHSLFTWYRVLIQKLPWWLARPLGMCYMCVTGQACLWYFIATRRFDFIELAFFVSAGIGLSMVYNKIYCWLDGNN